MKRNIHFFFICFISAYQLPILADQFSELVKKYDILCTVAGKGQQDDGNCWLPEFEGGSAKKAELSRPHFAMADKAGNIYIADKESHAIRKVTPQGSISTFAGTNTAGNGPDEKTPATTCDLNSPNGLWVSKEGAVYILDLGNSKIRKVSPQGTIQTIFSDPKGISLGRGIWVSEDEKKIYYCSASEIRLWDSDSQKTQVYVSGFSSLGNIILDPRGHVIATDRSSHRVYRILEDKSMIPIAGNGQTSGGIIGGKALDMALFGVRALWFYPDGSYLVGTHEGSQVWFIDTVGIINLFLDGMDDDDCFHGDGEHFLTPGKKISEVRNVSMDYDGNVMVVENDQGHIRVVQVRGNSIENPIPQISGKRPIHIGVTNKAIILTSTGTLPRQYLDVSLYTVKGEKLFSSVFRFVSPQTSVRLNSKTTPLPSGCYFIHIHSKNPEKYVQEIVVDYLGTLIVLE